MTNLSAPAWDIHQTNRRFYAPDQSRSVGYANLRAVGQNQIPVGTLALLSSCGGAIISERAAGPPVWSRDGDKLAFPECYQTIFRKRFQRIVVVDTVEETITLYKEKYTCLLLRKFEDNFIYGRDAGEKISLLAFNTITSAIHTKTNYRVKEIGLP
jgi:hypothetical protein